VTVTPTAIQVDDQPSREQLPSVRWKPGRAREKIVILKGDRKVMLGKAVNILDLAQAAGAKGIALGTKPPSPGDG
jgi:biopolymer transport protein ExbD